MHLHAVSSFYCPPDIGSALEVYCNFGPLLGPVGVHSWKQLGILYVDYPTAHLHEDHSPL